jgi:hypothetical protein
MIVFSSCWDRHRYKERLNGIIDARNDFIFCATGLPKMYYIGSSTLYAAVVFHTPKKAQSVVLALRYIEGVGWFGAYFYIRNKVAEQELRAVSKTPTDLDALFKIFLSLVNPDESDDVVSSYDAAHLSEMVVPYFDRLRKFSDEAMSIKGPMRKGGAFTWESTLKI